MIEKQGGGRGALGTDHQIVKSSHLGNYSGDREMELEVRREREIRRLLVPNGIHTESFLLRPRAISSLW